MAMRIDRCICTDRTFAELIERTREEDWTFEQLALLSGASEGCGLCRPYLRRAYRTGQTVFHELLDDE